MNIIHPLEYNKREHAFLFNAELKPPLVLLKNVLRSEQEYDHDINPVKTAQKIVSNLSKHFEDNVYSVISGGQPAKVDSFLARKSILPPTNDLRRLEQREIESFSKSGLIRKGLVISLADFDCHMGGEIILNFGSGLFVLSKKNIDVIAALVKNWLVVESNSGFNFNCDIIVQDLLKYEDTAVMRYFPADNGRPEIIAVIGNEGLWARIFNRNLILIINKIALSHRIVTGIKILIIAK